MNTMKEKETVYTQNPDVVARRIADEFLLVPVRRTAADVDKIYALNDTAGRIWELIDGNRSLSSIRDTIVAEYDIGASRAESDILACIKHMKKIGAIQSA